MYKYLWQIVYYMKESNENQPRTSKESPLARAGPILVQLPSISGRFAEVSIKEIEETAARYSRSLARTFTRVREYVYEI